jgi:biopolymer transport protein ExbB
MHDINQTLDALKYGGVTIYPLLALALLALVIIIDKAYLHWRYIRLPHSLVNLVETYGFTWEKLEQELAAGASDNYFSRFSRVLLANRDKPVWWVESRAGDEAQALEAGMNRGLWVLETIVTGAPLLGLLGTITGMMHAFNLIGGNGLVDPSGVTGGVAQALIATAFGIFIAIFSLFGYNYFSRRQARALEAMERLGTRIVDNMRLAHHESGALPESGSPA